ncbi:uncharacterized protein [Rutidosis leptorrhynchoides]|uniref:uncharacterized protein n=1 Tax=Rutidosis leptorrhynchoides TaxID=125765 RepID=UPI003A991258
MGILSKQLVIREIGTIPSNTLENPRGNQEIQAITSRSGKTTQDPIMPSQEEYQESLKETSNEKSIDDVPPEKVTIDKLLEHVPYPQQLRKEKKMFRELRKYVQSNKCKDNEKSSKFIIKECKAIFQKFDIPEKLGDSGSITVPCSFNNSKIYQALADTGIAENIPVNIDKFTFSADFIILEMKENDKIPIILGRTFQRTTSFEFQMQTNTYSLRIGDDRITLNNQLGLDLTCPSIKYMETRVEEEFDEFLLMDINEFVYEIKEENRDDEFEELENDEMNELMGNEHEPITDKLRINHSLKSPPKLELKELPSHLEYSFLKDDSELPAIISSELPKDQKEQLLDVLKKSKGLFLENL